MNPSDDVSEVDDSPPSGPSGKKTRKKSGRESPDVAAGGDSLEDTRKTEETSEVPSKEAPGETVGSRYEILELIGEGGMGVLYRATDPKLAREVAVKRLRATEDSAKKGIARFLQEARAIAALNHRNIVTIYDVGEDDHGPFIVMEYLRGEDLRRRIEREGKIDLEQALSIIRGVGQALAYAHNKGIIHRDVKPANITLTEDGTPKLADFGLARMPGESELSKTGDTPGTWAYMSPEQRRGARHVDQRSDIYALAKTLYHMVTGKVPDSVDLDAVPSEIRPALERALKPECEDRPSSVKEFLNELGQPSAVVGGPLAPGTVLPGTCVNCGATNPQGMRFCQSCGAGLVEKCPRCDLEGPLGIRYCGSCGVDISGYKEAKRAVASAQRHLSKFEYDQAEREARRVLRRGYLRDELEAILEEAARSKKRLAQLRAEVKELVEKERYEDAQEPLRAALELNPSDTHLRNLLRELSTKARQRDIRQALAEAGKAIEENRFPVALERCDWVLGEDADNEEATELKAQAERLQEDHRGRVAQARTSLEASQFNEALEQLRGLEEDYPWDGEIEKLSQEATRRKKEKLDELRAEAMELVEKERYEDAKPLLHRVLEVDPSREDLKALLKELPARIQQRNIRKALEEARKALEENRYSVALERCDWVLGQQADNEEARKLEAQAEKLKEDHRGRVAQARASLEASRFNEALKQLRGLEEDYPWDGEIEKLSQEAARRKQEKLDELRAQAMELIEKERYEDAEPLLRRALEVDPSREDLEALLKELPARIQQRNIRQALAEAGRALEEKRFPVALERCEWVLREQADNEEVGVLKLHAEKLQRDHELRLTRARGSLDDSLLLKALDQLAELERDYPWDDEIKKLQEAAIRNKKELDGLRARVVELVDKERYEEAEEPLRGALELDRSQEDLKSLLEDLAARIRDRDIRRALAQARKAVEEKRFPDALERCDWVLKEQDDNKEAVSLRARAEKLQQNHQERLARVRKSLDVLEASELNKAIKELKDLEKDYPWDKETQRLQREATTRREDTVRGLRAEAKELIEKERYEEAEELLRGALKLDPSQRELEARRKELSTKSVERDIRRALDDARKALQEKRFSVALEHCNWVLRRQRNKEAAELKARAEELQKAAKAVAVFGIYEAVAQHARTVGTTVWTARPVGSSSLPTFAVKAFDPSDSGWEEERVTVERESFLDSVHTQLKVGAGEARHWAPIFESGGEENKPFFVTRYYRRSAQWLLDRPLTVRSRMLRAIVSGIVEGLRELKWICGRPHGNLKPSNVLIEGEGRITPGKVVLTDPLPGTRLEEKAGEGSDLQAIGKLIYQLVLRRPFRLMGGWPIPRTEAWAGLGKSGETWRKLCDRLLDPDPARSQCSLETVAETVRALDKPRRVRKYAVAGASAAAILAVPSVFLLKSLQLPKIHVSGERLIVWEAGTPFEYPKYEATDRQDGDLTREVKRLGSVDDSKPGMYPLVYKVKDTDGNEASETRTVMVVDTRLPYVDELSPPPGARDVSVGANITFHIKDDGVGVDEASIKMTVNGSLVEKDRLSITGTGKDYTVSCDPPQDFGEYETVTVTVEAADRQGKEMKRRSHSFTTEDKTPPIIVVHKPAPDEEDVRIDTDISVSIKDYGAGVEEDSILVSVSVDGEEAQGESEPTPEREGYRVRWTPLKPFREGRKVTVTVGATDMARPANQMKREAYSFVTRWEPPYTAGHKPGPNEREVRTDTRIVLHVKDDGAGVDKDSIVLTVDDQQVKPAIEGSPKDYEVSYDPSQDFPELNPVTVKVQAADLDGRKMKPFAYTFTTTDATSPTTYAYTPAEGSNVVPTAKVSFRVRDDGAGVDQKSVKIAVDGATVAPVIRETTPGSAKDCTVSFSLPEDLKEDRIVRVTVDAKDLHDPPNAMKTATCSFSTNQPPSTSDYSPQDGEVGVRVDAEIKLRVKDIGSGVKKGSIDMMVNGWPVQRNLLKITGTPHDYEVRYDPPTDFGYNQTVTVTVEAEDVSGNKMEPKKYSFATGRGDVPEIAVHPKSVTVKLGDAVILEMEATSATGMRYQWKKDGIDIEGATSSSYRIPSARRSDAGRYVCEVTNLAGAVTSNPGTVTIDGPPEIVLSGEEVVTWEMGTPFPDEHRGHKAMDKEDGDLTDKVEVRDEVDPSKPGTYSQVYIVKDSAGNEARVSRTVNVVDTQPPFADEISPPDAAGNIPVGTNIALHIRDKGVGVDEATIMMTVNGSGVEKERLSVTGTGEDYTVSYDPPQDFGEYQTVTVTVEAADRQGKKMKPQTYSFRTEDRTPPHVSAHEPGKDDKNVSVRTDITLHIIDDGAGVKEDSIVVTVKVDGKEVGGQRELTQERGGYTVRWTPTTSFGYDQKVAAAAEARDAVGNQMKPYTFTFTTAVGDVPEIAVHPKSVTVKLGHAVILEMEATSATDMRYQWKKDGIDIEGATSSSYRIPSARRSDAGRYVCEVTNLAGAVTSDPGTVMIDGPPEIVLSGEEVVTWEMGTPFPDEHRGHKAMDKEDGDLTDKVEVRDEVDPSKPGTYSQVYIVKDSAGNEARVTRIVNVVDTQPPFADEISPAEGADVRGGTEISFRIKDNGVGVDKDSITVTVDGAIIEPTITATPGSPKDYGVSLTLPEKLEEDRAVKVAVDAEDLHDPPNVMTTQTHTFRIVKVALPPEFDFEAFWKDYVADFRDRKSFERHYLRQEDMKWYTTLRLEPVRIEWDERDLYSRLEDKGENVVFKVKFKALFRTFAGLVTQEVDEVWVIEPKTRKIIEVQRGPPRREVSVDPESLYNECPKNAVAEQTFELRSLGGGEFNYSITDDAAWLACDPAKGSLTDQPTTVKVTYNTSGLSVDTHKAEIEIVAEGAGNARKKIPVELRVEGWFEHLKQEYSNSFGTRTFDTCFKEAAFRNYWIRNWRPFNPKLEDLKQLGTLEADGESGKYTVKMEVTFEIFIRSYGSRKKGYQDVWLVAKQDGSGVIEEVRESTQVR